MSFLAACAAPAASPTGEQAAVPEAAVTSAAAEEAAAEAAPDAAGDAPEQVLIGGFDVGPGGDPQVIPYFQGAGNTWLSKLYTPLVMMTADFAQTTADGSLSESWESSEDLTTWTFNLRPGVTWHDGEPFTADDVAFTFKLVNNPESVTINTGILGDIGIVEGLKEYREGTAEDVSGITVVDENTIEFKLTAPDPRFPDKLRWTYILPEHALADLPVPEMREWDWWFTNPVGTGPFKFSAFERDQFMELVPNEAYWDGKPLLDKLINRYFADETAAVLALQAGDIDFTYVSSDVAKTMEGDAAYEVFSGPSYVANFIVFNARNPQWQDERVRKAFLYGIDRQAIVDEIYQGSAVVAPCADPYDMYWPADADPYAYDPELAKQLLAEAGYDTSAEYENITYYTGQLANDVMQAFQAYLAEIGVKTTPRFMEPAAWRAIVEGDLNYDIAYRGMGAGPAEFPDRFYVPDLYPTLEGGYYGFDDPELVGLIEAMNATTNFEDYKTARTAVCSYMNKVALQPFMWVGTRYGVARDGLENFYYFPAPGGGPYLDRAETWSIAK
jgi:peptide/nickel transport system substrate-binding protein